MHFFVIGVNHKTAPISIREKFFLNEIERDYLLSELKSDPSIVEAFVVSTCNRTELYIHSISDVFQDSHIVQHICSIKKIDYNTGLLGYFYTLKGEDMVRHILQVVCGLDSLVLGEKQILGQVRDALLRSQEKGFLSTHFNILSNIVLRCGKKVRTETDIDCGGSSVSWAAIAKAEQALHGLDDKKVLMIGAGEMSKLAVGQFSTKGFEKLYLMNRTREHAEALADQIAGEVVGFCDIKEVLAQVDLCVCCSGAPHYILEEELVSKVMQTRKGQKLVIVDISMPRNVDPKIHDVENVVLYDIDDLDSVVAKNMQKREQAVEIVHTVIEEKIGQYQDKIQKIKECQEEMVMESFS